MISVSDQPLANNDQSWSRLALLQSTEFLSWSTLISTISQYQNGT